MPNDQTDSSQITKCSLNTSLHEKGKILYDALQHVTFSWFGVNRYVVSIMEAHDHLVRSLYSAAVV